MSEENRALETADGREEERRSVQKNIILICLLMAGGILAAVYFSIGVKWGAAEAVSEPKNQVIEKGAVLGVDGADSITGLGSAEFQKKRLFWGFTDSGEAVVLDDDFSVEARADNPAVDLNRELPRSIAALGWLGGNQFIGGTTNGQINLYVMQNQQLVVRKFIDEFRSRDIRDAIAGSGSVTHIFISPSRTRAIVANYDGLLRVLSIDGEEIKVATSFQLTAAVVSGKCISEQEAWTVSADGRVSVFNLDNMSRPAREFDVSDFGRIRGADYAAGKFLIYGHSLEVKTASVAVYDRAGKLLEILTKSGGSRNIEQTPLAPSADSTMEEMPTIADLGESFNDAEWLDEAVIGAVKGNQFYILDLAAKKVSGVELPLKQTEDAREFIRTGENTFIIGTSAGRVFERKIKLGGKSQAGEYFRKELEKE